MKITSFANSAFPIDGVLIVPGTKDYKKLDVSKRAVKYQLGILKAEGQIDFKELIPARPHRLPFVGKEQGLKEDAEDKEVDTKKPATIKGIKSEAEKLKGITERATKRAKKREQRLEEQKKDVKDAKSNVKESTKGSKKS